MNYSVGGALNEAGDYENFSSSSPDEAEIGGGVQSSVLPSRVVTRQLPSQQQPVANSTVIHQTLHPNSPPRYYLNQHLTNTRYAMKYQPHDWFI